MGFASPKPNGVNGAQANGSRDSAAPRNGLKGRDIKEGGPAGSMASAAKGAAGKGMEGSAGGDDGGKVVELTDFRPTSPAPPKYRKEVEGMKFPPPPGELPPSVGVQDEEWEGPEAHNRPTKPSDSPGEVAGEQELLGQMRESGELAPPPAPKVKVTRRNYGSSLSLSDEQTEKLWAEYYRLQGLQKKGGD